MPHRAFRPDRLAEAEPLEEADVDRAEDDDAEEREQQAEDDRQHAGHRRIAGRRRRQRVDRAIQADAARRLEEHDVADGGGQLALDLLHRGVGVVDAHDVPEAGGTRRLGDPAAPVPDRHEAIDDAGRQPADLAMLPLLVGPELQHVAEHRIAAPAGGKGCLGEELERCRHAPGSRVVRVVDERRAAGRLDRRHAVRGMAARRERRLDLVERRAEALRHGGRGERMRHEVAAGHGEPQAPHAPRCGERERGAGEAAAGHLAGADVGAGAEAEGRHRGGGGRRHGGDARVVGIEDGEAVTRAAQRAARPWRARSPRCCRRAEVDRLDVRGRCRPRARDLGQACDLALRVHAHLEHRHAVRIGQARRVSGQAASPS